MKKLLPIVIFGSVSLLSADQYYQPYGNPGCSSCNSGGGNYQGQSSYYQNQGQSNEYQRWETNRGPDQQYNPQQNYRPYDRDLNYQQQNNRSNDRNQQQNDRNQQQNYSNNNNNSSNSGDWKNNGQKAVSDQEITKQIRDTLSSGWFSSGYQGVSFDVNNGNVNLSGTVDSIDNKNKVENAVKKIDGVKQVNNQISIAKDNANGYSDSQLQNSEKKYPQDTAATDQDRQLNAKIRDKLSGGWFTKGFDALILRTNNGFVVITGTVDQPQDVQKVNDQLKDVDGVKSIDNRVTSRR